MADNDSEGGEENEAEDEPDRLQAMMDLLEDHEDKWEESNAGDARYEVTLPDGDIEHARTRDDVRALLYKHYG